MTDTAPTAEFEPALWPCLRHPVRQLRAFDTMWAVKPQPPSLVWAGLVAIAVGGSFLYGASLSFVFPQWHPVAGAVWLALSAGLGWCVLGPALILFCRRNPFTLAHACMVAMAYGEGVLVIGAAFNLLLARFPSGSPLSPLSFNIGLNVVGNLTMATILALQLRAVQVPIWKTLLLWMLFLNGSGALFFSILRPLLQKGG